MILRLLTAWTFADLLKLTIIIIVVVFDLFKVANIVWFSICQEGPLYLFGDHINLDIVCIASSFGECFVDNICLVEQEILFASVGRVVWCNFQFCE